MNVMPFHPLSLPSCTGSSPALHVTAMGLLPASVATAFANKPVLILKLLGIFVSALLVTKVILTSSMAATVSYILLQLLKIRTHCVR
jgi:hypothetical protein